MHVSIYLTPLVHRHIGMWEVVGTFTLGFHIFSTPVEQPLHAFYRHHYKRTNPTVSLLIIYMVLNVPKWYDCELCIIPLCFMEAEWKKGLTASCDWGMLGAVVCQL